MESFEQPLEQSKEGEKKKEEVKITFPAFVIEDEVSVPTGRGYRILAKEIERQYGLSESEAEEMVFYLNNLNLRPEEVSHKKILDVGSGWGSFKQAVQKIAEGQVTNLDLDRKYQDYIDVLARAQALPFQDESFDLVLAHCSVPVMQSRTQAESISIIIDEMIRIVKKGGIIKIYPGLWGGKFEHEDAVNNQKLNEAILKRLEEIVEDNPFLEIKAIRIKHPEMPDIDFRLLEIRKPLDGEITPVQ